MAHFKFLLAFLALLICAGGVAGSYYYYKKFYEPEISLNRQISGEGKRVYDLGERHFQTALDLLEDGELVAARDRLLYLLQYFPESRTYEDAKRVVGEVNMDLLLSRIPQPRKQIHVVRRGEALVTIARRSQTTIDYIMRTNGKTTDTIYPDEELIVCPLDFRAEIDLENERIAILEGDEFFKEYRILDSHLPPEVRAPVSTSVNEKVAWHKDRPVNFTNENYMNCSKWLRTGKIGLFIREESRAEEEGRAKPFGVMVAKTDLEEIFTILRVGSPVTVVN